MVFVSETDDRPLSPFLSCTDGIIRTRYRDPTSTPSLVEPGRAYGSTIDLWATSNVFKAGHRIRVKVSSSNSPASTGTPTQAADGRGRRTHTALQTILHSAPYPSPITLPIVPRYGGRGEACLKACWSQPSPSIQGEGWAGRKESAASVHLQSGGLW